MAVRRGTSTTRTVRRSPPPPVRPGQGRAPATRPATNPQATKAAVNRALGKVSSGKTRPVTISQVQNDPSIGAKDKQTIIKALQRRNARRTEG